MISYYGVFFFSRFSIAEIICISLSLSLSLSLSFVRSLARSFSLAQHSMHTCVFVSTCAKVDSHINLIEH